MNISVAMCTYNGSRYLEEQLKSVAEQSVLPYEMIVCDDGSTDDTVNILRTFASRASFPVHVYQNEQTLGSTRNFEQAIRLCQGDMIALCDQDDRWLPEKLAELGGYLRNDPSVGGVFSNAFLMDDGGETLPSTLWNHSGFTPQRQADFSATRGALQLIRQDTVTGAALMFRASYVSALLPIAEPWVHDGWIALLIASLGRLEALPACLMYYRLHSEQQIGLKKVPWYAHLSTQKALALRFHAHQAERYESIAERLKLLCFSRPSQIELDPIIDAELQRVTAFYKARIVVLGRPRVLRFSSIRLLSEYSRYERGILSWLRDLLH